MFEEYTLSEESLQSPATPNLSDALELVDQLTIRMESIDSLYQQVSREGLVSRSQIEFLVENCGIEFDGRYPVASFTQEPSATNLSIATEAMGGQFFATIGEFLKKVVTVILSILKWVFELLTGYSARRENVTRVAENMKKVAKSNREVEAAMAKLPKPAQSSQTQEMFAKFQGAMAVYDNSWNDFREQLLTHGEFVRFLRTFSVYILGYMPQLTARVEAFKRLIDIEEKENDPGHQIAIKVQFARLVEPASTNQLIHALHGSGVQVGNGHSTLSSLHNPTFLELATAIKGRMSELQQQRSNDPVMVSQASELVEKDDKVLDSFLVKDQQQRKMIEALIDDYKKILNSAPRRKYSDDVNKQYRSVVEQLTNEVRGLQVLIDLYNEADNETARFIKVLTDAVFSRNLLLEASIKDYPEEAQKQLRDVINQGRSFLTKVK